MGPPRALYEWHCGCSCHKGGQIDSTRTIASTTP